MRDFFLAYPPIEELYGFRNSISFGQYEKLRKLSSGNKPSQRNILREHGFSIPPTATTHQDSTGLRAASDADGYPSTRFIVRPLRHSQGQGWRVTQEPTDFQEGREYIQAVYPKNHEYRIIVVRGKPLITLLKRTPDNLARSQPWNHANGSSFVTVTDPSNDRLRHTDLYDLIAASPLFKHLDLVGIDVMYRRAEQYALSEVNLCPALQIPSNIEKVAAYVHSLPETR